MQKVLTMCLNWSQTCFKQIWGHWLKQFLILTLWEWPRQYTSSSNGLYDKIRAMVPLDSFAEALTQTWLLTHTDLFDIYWHFTSQIWHRKLPSDIPCFVPSRQAWLEALRTSSYIFLLRIIFQLGLSWTLTNFHHSVNLVWKRHGATRQSQLDSAAMT